MGEVHAIRPLITLVRDRHPDLPILITTLTPTGAEAVERLPENIFHRYLPWDATSAVRRFLRHIRPRCAIIVETELWPNLYLECARQGIPPLIINGRLTQKSLRASHWLRIALGAALQHCTAILARSPQDAENFTELGAEPEKVRCIGNIKYAKTVDSKTLESQSALSRPYVLAASTHEDEEVRITRAWLQNPLPGHLLVLAPRHPQRARQLIPQLSALTPHVSVRSRREAIRDETVVYLADTLGELPWLIHHAESVFMGGSLIPRGGHNLIEPAQLGKAILTGPSSENFAEEHALLSAANALVEVRDETVLVEQFHHLAKDKERRRQLETNALAAVAPYEGIAQTYTDAVLNHCGCASE